MNRRNNQPKRRTPRHERSVWERLEDSNEQEQEKSGIPSMRQDKTAFVKETPQISEKSAEQPAASEQTSPVERAVTLPPQPPCRKEEQAIEKRAEEETAWVGEENSTEEKPSKEKKRKEKNASPLLWGAILTVILLIFLAVLMMSLTLGTRYAANIESDTEQDTVDAAGEAQKEKVVFIRQYEDGSGLLTTAELYGKCADSVVSIVTKSETGSGVGSGFFLTEDGYIGTANHVVAGMDELTVVLADGTRCTASLVAGNAMTDLAVLKIEGVTAPAVSFGRSSELLTGEKVIAIGTPASLDYAGSVCSGEVSYGLRTVRVYRESTGILEKKMTLIQTDAPVNPGNSGCPLFDEYGSVVGIVTMKLGKQYAGIGFAIPSDGALPIYEAMIAGEKLSDALLSAVSTAPPRLGIAGESAWVDGVYGVRILQVTEQESDAFRALRSGDVIVAIDGKTVTTVAEIAAIIEEKAPKDRVVVTVIRDGLRLGFEISLL